MARRQWWQRPQLRVEEDMNIHRKVSWLELFFDLFFVVIISSVSHNLSAHLSWRGLLEMVLSFLPVWWVWIGFTVYNERFETEGLENRLFTFFLMIPVASMAVFAEDCTGHNFVPYAISYALCRAQIIFHWARAGYYDKKFRKTAQYYTAGFTTALCLVLLSTVIESSLRYFVFGVALTIDLMTPGMTLRLQKVLPKFSTSKLPERFGLIVIIVLGEVVVGVINGIKSDSSYLVNDFFTGVLGLLLGFGFWWIYFDYIGRRKFKPRIIHILLWNYLHCFLLIGFIMQGAAVFSSLGHSVSHFANLLLVIGFSATMIFLLLLEMVLDRGENEPTHPLWSPGLKISTGLIALLLIPYLKQIGLFTLMGVLSLLQSVHIVYGIWVWFSQEIPDQKAPV